jgi:hypothetical protein
MGKGGGMMGKDAPTDGIRAPGIGKCPADIKIKLKE